MIYITLKSINQTVRSVWTVKLTVSTQKSMMNDDGSICSREGCKVGKKYHSEHDSYMIIGLVSFIDKIIEYKFKNRSFVYF